MLRKVMIDFKGIESYKNDLDEREYLLLPYIYLFADEVLEPVVCEDASFPEVEVLSFIKPVYIFNENPPFVCDYAITTFKIGKPHGFQLIYGQHHQISRPNGHGLRHEAHSGWIKANPTGFNGTRHSITSPDEISFKHMLITNIELSR